MASTALGLDPEVGDFSDKQADMYHMSVFADERKVLTISHHDHIEVCPFIRVSLHYIFDLGCSVYFILP